MEHQKTYIVDNNGDKREAIELICHRCGKKFLRPKHLIKENSYNHYCSRKCAQENSRNRITVQCAYCGKEKEITKSRYDNCKSKLFFCCKKCKDEGQKVENGLKSLWPAHYDNGNSKYRKICFDNHPHKCCVCDEKLIVEVHHYDKNRKNSDPKNLIPLCPTHHKYMHSEYKYLIEDKVKEYIKSL